MMIEEIRRSIRAKIKEEDLGVKTQEKEKIEVLVVIWNFHSKEKIEIKKMTKRKNQQKSLLKSPVSFHQVFWLNTLMQ